MSDSSEIEVRIDRLHSSGVVDLHFDLPMELYEKRDQAGLFAHEILPQLVAGDAAVIGAALYIEDRYLPDQALAVAQEQMARLHAECDSSGAAVICRTYHEIVAARAAGKIAFLIAMEGVEPLGNDLDLLRLFYEAGVRSIGLTHARRNAAGAGGIFAPNGSPADGLTNLGRDIVRQCDELGIIIDLAHISPAGFDDILALTSRPPIVSHTNARRYYDIERNISDDQIRAVGERGGVIGINSILVSPRKEESTLDGYVDHIRHVADLIGIDHVGIGFDFFHFIYRQWPQERKDELASKLTAPNFILDLLHHGHTRNLTRRLLGRGFADAEIEKILHGNWMRILRQLL